MEPKDLEEFVEYFLNTDMDDMRYEVTRYRPKLTPEFFTYLDKVIGMERFSDDPNQERISELESLRAYLEVRKMPFPLDFGFLGSDSSD